MSLILNNTEVFFASFNSNDIRIKEVRCKMEARKRLDPDDRRGFFILLPELKIIYHSGDGEHHSAVIFHQCEKGSKIFDEWVSISGLKYVKEYEPSMKKNLEEEIRRNET